MDTDALVNEYLLHKREEHKHPLKPRTFYCSELGYCPRKLYYKRLMPRDPDVDSLKIFLIGDMLHDKMSEILGFSYKHIESEGRLCLYLPTLDIRLSGRFDDLVIDDKDEPIVIEKKSTKTLKYVLGKNAPQKHHEEQVMMYMKALGIENAVVLYIEKNTLKTATFKVEFDAKKFQNLIDKAAGVQKSLDDGVLPPRAPMGSWECKFACPYKQECDKNFNPSEWKQDKCHVCGKRLKPHEVKGMVVKGEVQATCKKCFEGATE